MDGIEPLTGDYGTAVPMVLPDGPRFAPLLQHWLVTSVNFSPDCSQYIVAAMSLFDIPNIQSPSLMFSGATHEIDILPLDPYAGQQTAHSVVRRLAAEELEFPAATCIRCQVSATTEEITELIPWIAGMIVRCGWSPDVTAAPDDRVGFWRGAVYGRLTDLRVPRELRTAPRGRHHHAGG
jgi:hypothetical protein